MFENYEQRIDGINKVLKKYDISSLEEAKQICDDAGIDVYNMVKMYREYALRMLAGHIFWELV